MKAYKVFCLGTTLFCIVWGILFIPDVSDHNDQQSNNSAPVFEMSDANIVVHDKQEKISFRATAPKIEFIEGTFFLRGTSAVSVSDGTDNAIVITTEDFGLNLANRTGSSLRTSTISFGTWETTASSLAFQFNDPQSSFIEARGVSTIYEE